MKKIYKGGFSLIELSIVLIIIGLLVAGITGGASLIRSAELRSVMSDIRNYQTGINAYYTATGTLPGGNQMMDFTKSCVAWADMANEGIVDAKLSDFSGNAGSYTCTDTITKFTDQNSIPSKIKGSLYVIGNNTPMNENVVVIVAPDETPAKVQAANSDTTSPVKTSLASTSRRNAKFLDDKMDNGQIDSGKVQSFSSEGAGATVCQYDNTAAKDCTPAISVGL